MTTGSGVHGADLRRSQILPYGMTLRLAVTSTVYPPSSPRRNAITTDIGQYGATTAPRPRYVSVKYEGTSDGERATDQGAGNHRAPVRETFGQTYAEECDKQWGGREGKFLENEAALWAVLRASRCYHSSRRQELIMELQLLR